MGRVKQRTAVRGGEAHRRRRDRVTEKPCAAMERWAPRREWAFNQRTLAMGAPSANKVRGLITFSRHPGADHAGDSAIALVIS